MVLFLFGYARCVKRYTVTPPLNDRLSQCDKNRQTVWRFRTLLLSFYMILLRKIKRSNYDFLSIKPNKCSHIHYTPARVRRQGAIMFLGEGCINGKVKGAVLSQGV